MDETMMQPGQHGSATDFDAEFERLFSAGGPSGGQSLQWLPWVGQLYAQRPPDRRLLIVGESHYCKGGNGPDGYLTDRSSTRYQVWDGGSGTPTWKWIPWMLLGTSKWKDAQFWSDTAYYNFVQRPMNSSGERPGWEDFCAGWRVFQKVIGILQPSHCLFLGVTSAKHYSFKGRRYAKEKVNGVWPVSASYEEDGIRSELIFVRHPAKYFTWSKWHEHLKAIHPNLMGWLEAEHYAQIG